MMGGEGDMPLWNSRGKEQGNEDPDPTKRLEGRGGVGTGCQKHVVGTGEKWRWAAT